MVIKHSDKQCLPNSFPLNPSVSINGLFSPLLFLTHIRTDRGWPSSIKDKCSQISLKVE